MKTMRTILGVLTAAVLMFAFAGQAGAFCVHNKSDRNMYVEQKSGGKVFKGFNVNLNPGEDACCNWANKDCNKDGGAGDTVGFIVSYEIGDVLNRDTHAVCQDYKIPANGDLYINGSNGNYSCSQ